MKFLSFKEAFTKKNFKRAGKESLMFFAKYFEEFFLFSLYFISLFAPQDLKLNKFFVSLCFFWTATAIMRVNYFRRQQVDLLELLTNVGYFANQTNKRLNELEKEPWQRES